MTMLEIEHLCGHDVRLDESALWDCPSAMSALEFLWFMVQVVFWMLLPIAVILFFVWLVSGQQN